MKNFNINISNHKSAINASVNHIAELFTQGETILINGHRLQSEYKGKFFNAEVQRSGTFTQRKAHALQIIHAQIARI